MLLNNSGIDSQTGEGMKKKTIIPYLFITPFLIAFVLFFVYPAGYSLYLSFLKYKGYGEATFVGFQNYKALLTYALFWKSLGNTAFYFLAHFVPVMAGAFLFALAMQSSYIGRAQKVIKPVLFLPQVVPLVASALIFKIIFSTNSGALNHITGLHVKWLEDPGLLKWPVVFLIIWRSVGWFMVIFLAGLTTISSDLNEAATLDGANNWQRITKITIPLMKPIFLFAFVTDVISSFKIYTEPNVMMVETGTIPVDAQPVMNIITNHIKGGNFGMASAAGWILFLIILVVSLAQLFLMKNKED